MDEQLDRIAVHAADGFGCRCHTDYRRQRRNQRFQRATESGLCLGGERTQLLERRARIDRWRRSGDIEADRCHRGDHPRIGSRIVAQIHYNLLEGHAPDQSSVVLRETLPGHHVTTLHTMLLPAPVELPK